jgi:integrase
MTGFSAETGRENGRQPVEGSFEDLLDRSGIKDFRFHDLRHTFGDHICIEE